MIHRLFASLHDSAPRIAEDAINALAAVGLFGVFGVLIRACVAVAP